MKYLLKNGVKIELFLSPLPPVFWDRYDVKLKPILPEIEEYCHNIAKKYNLKITGSFNPYKVGISNEGFYDARHIRREAISKYFDLKP